MSGWMMGYCGRREMRIEKIVGRELVIGKKQLGSWKCDFHTRLGVLSG